MDGPIEEHSMDLQKKKKGIGILYMYCIKLKFRKNQVIQRRPVNRRLGGFDAFV